MIKTPPLSRITLTLIFGIALVAALYYGRSFFVPFTFAVIFSMLVLPVCNKLESWGWPRGLAIAVCILLILAAWAILVGVLAAPIASFNQDLPQLVSSFQEKLQQVQQFISEKLNVPIQKQNSLMQQASSSLQSVGKYVAGFFTGFLGFLTDAILVLVYVIFFLLYREKYENFVVKLNQENNPDEVRQILHQISHVSSQYLVGRLLSIIILAVLYSSGLALIGLKYALLMGSIGALLTIVPYIGTALGGIFPAAVALFSGSGTSPIAAIAVILGVQLLDDYFLEPFIVGGKVNISPITIIIAIVVGGLIWGVAGMILFIPMIGMTKVVFDHVPSLHPYGYLIGMPESKENKYVQKVKNWFKDKF